MTNCSRLERPNIVAGPLVKRKELLAARKQLEADLRKVTCDLDHLDATIRLFDPQVTPAAVARYATQHRAKKGHLRRFVLGFLRQAGDQAATSREITAAWIEARGLRADDATFVLLRKRVGACLLALRADGLVRNGEGREGYVGYALAQEGDTASHDAPQELARHHGVPFSLGKGCRSRRVG